MAKKQSVLDGAVILMAGVIAVKIIGVLFKMPLSNMIGSVGRGYFSSAYEIITPILAVAMTGLPVAISRMVAENVALGNCREARAVFSVSKKVFTAVGIAGTVILLAAAVPYAKLTGKGDYFNVLLPVISVSPLVFICCIVSAYRGYYEGLQNMTPVAVSQIIEAFGKLCIGLALAKTVSVIGISQFENGGIVFGKAVENSEELSGIIAPVSAAAAMAGVTAGSLMSLIYVVIYHRIRGDGFTRGMLINSRKQSSSAEIFRKMAAIAVPMVISTLIMNITNIIDTTTIQARLLSALNKDYNSVYLLHRAAIDKAVSLGRLNASDIPKTVRYLWGAYGTALDFKTLVPTVTVQLGVSALPALAAGWVAENKYEIRSTIETVIRICMLISLPAGFGMACLAEPILNMLYGRGASSDSVSVIVPMLIAYGIATPLIAVSTPAANMLQAIGRTDIPMKSVSVAAVCKIICNYVLVGNPKINIYGAVAGTVLFYLIIVVCNVYSLLKISDVKISIKSTILKPLFCAVLCGAAAYVTYSVLSALINSDISDSVLNGSTLAAAAAVICGAAVYIISLLLLGGITKSDIIILPKGEKISKMLEKYRLLG